VGAGADAAAAGALLAAGGAGVAPVSGLSLLQPDRDKTTVIGSRAFNIAVV
jgi:hypothetical protein